MIITSNQVYSQIYFAAHAGTVDLVLGKEVREAIRREDGPITLTAAAAEDLLTNLQINSETARNLAKRHE